jgi:hypothetical protein
MPQSLSRPLKRLILRVEADTPQPVVRARLDQCSLPSLQKNHPQLFVLLELGIIALFNNPVTVVPYLLLEVMDLATQLLGFRGRINLCNPLRNFSVTNKQSLVIHYVLFCDAELLSIG